MARRVFSWITRSKSGICVSTTSCFFAAADLATVAPCDDESEEDVHSAEGDAGGAGAGRGRGGGGGGGGAGGGGRAWGGKRERPGQGAPLLKNPPRAKKGPRGERD